MFNYVPPTIFTLPEAAKYAGCAKQVVHDAAVIGALPIVKIEGRRFVRFNDLREWMAKRGARQ